MSSGATGWVYSAAHVQTGRAAAIKLLRSEFSAHDQMVARFLKEARAINAVGHPNIVQVYGTGLLGKQHYMILELLVGETLDARLERVKRLSVEEALPIFLEVADALAAAHDRHVVHRDVKPENIFLADRGDQGEAVKVLDFGIAKLIDPDADVRGSNHGPRA